MGLWTVFQWDIYEKLSPFIPILKPADFSLWINNPFFSAQQAILFPVLHMLYIIDNHFERPQLVNYYIQIYSS